VMSAEIRSCWPSARSTVTLKDSPPLGWVLRKYDVVRMGA
jgi:hypothetical protein